MDSEGLRMVNVSESVGAGSPQLLNGCRCRRIIYYRNITEFS